MMINKQSTAVVIDQPQPNTSGRMHIHSIVAVMAMFSAHSTTLAGDLMPPPGAVAATMMKTIDEVEPRTPVQSLPGDAGALDVISEPGSYYLNASIQGESGKDGIVIRTSDVSLDLNGFEVIGLGEPATTGILFENGVFPGDGNLRVTNGVVRSWGDDGIDFGLADPVIVSGVLALDNGSDGIRVNVGIVRECRAQGNGQSGIIVGVGLIHDSVATGNTRTGLATSFTLVRNSVAQSNDLDGISGFVALIADCASESNGGFDPMTLELFGSGIRLNGAGLVTRCATQFNAYAGIDTSIPFASNSGATALIGGCTAFQNALYGFDLEAPAHVSGCTVRLNGDVGIRSGSQGFLATACDSSENGNHGIEATVDSYVFGTKCEGNGTSGAVGAGIFSSGVDNRIQSNNVTGNDIGIQTVDSFRSLIIGNVASGNGFDYSFGAGSASGSVLNVTGGGAITSTNAAANIRY